MAKKKAPLISDEKYHQLAAMPSEKEWLDNCKAKSPNTACAYERDLNDFKSFVGITGAEDFRRVTRKHLVDWVSALKKRKITEPGRRNYGKKLSKMTIKRKLYAVGSYFKYCCRVNALRDSPVRGVETPGKRSREGAYAFLSKQEVKRFGMPLPLIRWPVSGIELY